MNIVNAAAARGQLSHLLDEVEQGEEVVVERRGVRFRLVLDVSPREDIPPSPLIIDDPEVLAGNWTWRSAENGQLVFQAREE